MLILEAVYLYVDSYSSLIPVASAESLDTQILKWSGYIFIPLFFHFFMCLLILISHIVFPFEFVHL